MKDRAFSAPWQLERNFTIYLRASLLLLKRSVINIFQNITTGIHVSKKQKNCFHFAILNLWRRYHFSLTKLSKYCNYTLNYMIMLCFIATINVIMYLVLLLHKYILTPYQWQKVRQSHGCNIVWRKKNGYACRPNIDVFDLYGAYYHRCLLILKLLYIFCYQHYCQNFLTDNIFMCNLSFDS